MVPLGYATLLSFNQYIENVYFLLLESQYLTALRLKLYDFSQGIQKV